MDNILLDCGKLLLACVLAMTAARLLLGLFIESIEIIEHLRGRKKAHLLFRGSRKRPKINY